MTLCKALLSLLVLPSLSFGASEEYWGVSHNKGVYRGVSTTLKAAVRLAKVPSKIQGKFRSLEDLESKVYSADWDMDGRADYVVTGLAAGEPTPAQNPEFRCSGTYAYLVSSAGRIRQRLPWGCQDGFRFLWFAHLKGAGPAQLLDFAGDEDYSDYRFMQLDAKSWEPKLLFPFHPVLIDKNRASLAFWGYPWDIEDLIVRKVDGVVKILATFDYPESWRDDDHDPAEGRSLPFIFFKGKATQDSRLPSMDRVATYFSLDELTRSYAKRKAAVPTAKVEP